MSAIGVESRHCPLRKKRAAHPHPLMVDKETLRSRALPKRSRANLGGSESKGDCVDSVCDCQRGNRQSVQIPVFEPIVEQQS